MGAKVVGLKFEVDGFPVVVKNTKEYSALLTKVEARMNRISKIKASKAIPTDLKNLRQTSSVLTRIKNQLTAISKIKPIKTPVTGGSPRKKPAGRPQPSSVPDNNDATRKAIKNQGDLKRALKETRQAIDGTDFGTDKLRKLQIQQASLKNVQKGLRDAARKTSQALEFKNVDPTSIRGLELQYIKLRNQVKKLGDEDKKSAFGKRLILQTKRVKASLNSAKLEFNDFTSNIGNYKSGLNSLGGSFRKLALTFGIGFGINEVGRAVTEGIKLFATFDQQLAILQSVSRSTKAELAPLKEEILRLGESTQFTAKQAADAAIILSRAGLSNESVLASLEPVLQGAIATGGSLADVAGVTANALASLKIPASEAGNFIAQLTGTLNSSKNDLGTYKEALKEFAPVANALKIPLEEVNGVIGLIADNGLQGTIGTTTLKTSLTRLADETKKYAKSAKRLKVDVFDANGEFVGMANLLENLEGAYKTFTPQQKLAATTQIFGAQATNQLTALLNAQKEVVIDGEKVTLKGSAALRGYTEAIKEGTEAAKESAAIVGDTLSQDMLKFQSAVEGATISLVEGYNGGLRSFVQGLTELAPKLIQNIDLILKIAAGIAIIAFQTKIATALEVTYTAARATAATVWGVLTGQIKIATLAQRAFNTASKANPIGLLITAVTSAYLAYQLFARFGNEAAIAQRKLNNATRSANVEFEKEKRTIESLFEPLKSDTATRKEKAEAIKELQKLYPDYLKGVDLEKATVKELDKAQKSLLDSLKKTIIERRKQSEVAPLIEKEIEAQLRLNEIREKGIDALSFIERQEVLGQRNRGESNEELSIRRASEKLQKEIDTLREEREAIDEAFDSAFGDVKRGRNAGRFGASVAKLYGEAKEEIKDTGKVADTASKKISQTTEEIVEVAKTGLAFYEAEISRLNDELKSADASEYLKLSKILVESESKAKGLREDLEAAKNSIIAANREPLVILTEIEAGGLPDSIEAPTSSNPLEGEGGIRAELNARKEATRGFLESTKLDQLNQERQILNEKLFNSDVEFKGRLRIADELAAKELEIEREKEVELDKIRDERYKKIAAVLSGVQDGLGVLSEIGDIRSQRQLNKVEETYQREIELAGENEEAKEAAEVKFEAAKRKIDEKSFKRNQAFAITQALINGALAATQALANTTLPFPISLTALIPIAIQTGLQVASIRSQKFKGEQGLYLSQDEVIHFGNHKSDSPGYMAKGGSVRLGGFAKGKRHSQGGIHTRFHGIPVEIEDGEFVDVMEDGGIAVINRKSSRAFAPTLRQSAGKIFNGKREMFSKINQRYGGVKFEGGGVVNSFAPNIAALGRESFRGKGISVEIDSKRIGREVARAVKREFEDFGDLPKQIKVAVKEGVSETVQNIKSETEQLNQAR